MTSALCYQTHLERESTEMLFWVEKRISFMDSSPMEMGTQENGRGRCTGAQWFFLQESESCCAHITCTCCKDTEVSERDRELEDELRDPSNFLE